MGELTLLAFVGLLAGAMNAVAGGVTVGTLVPVDKIGSIVLVKLAHFVFGAAAIFAVLKIAFGA